MNDKLLTGLVTFFHFQITNFRSFLNSVERNPIHDFQAILMVICLKTVIYKIIKIWSGQMMQLYTFHCLPKKFLGFLVNRSLQTLNSNTQ